jgi:hypothetical protein
MKSFSDLLLIISKKIPTETIVRDFLIQYLKEKHDIQIDRKNIHLSKNTVQLRVSPIIKAKLNPYKTTLIEDLNIYLQEKEIKDVIKNIL